MKNARPAGLLGLLIWVSALSCQTERTPEATAESVQGVGADAANAKFSIQSLESKVVVAVQTNPAELTLTKANSWAGKGQTGGDAPEAEFASAEPKTLTFELMFDLYEEQGNVHEEFVRPLLELADPLAELGRPPRVLVRWGSGLPPFEGVIAHVGTKYTMFSPDGTPVRASANVTVRESSDLPCSTDGDCAAAERCRQGSCQFVGK